MRSAEPWCSSPRSRPRVRVLDTPEQFYGLENAWRELSESASWVSPFHSWDFAVEWFERFVLARAGGATGQFKVIVVVDEDERPIGVAPMFEECVSALRELGTTLQPFGRAQSFETMTDEPIVVLRRQAERLAWTKLIGALTEQCVEASCDVAVLTRYRAPGLGRARLGVLGDAGYARRTRPICPTLELDLSSHGRFRQRLSKSMRDNLGYYPRRLLREVSDWRVDLARSHDAVGAAAAELIELHGLRSAWSEGVRHTSHIPGTREAGFLIGWVRRLASRGKVTIARLIVRDEVVAAQAFVEEGGTVAAYYSGQLEQWRRYSPLTIITSEVIRDAIDRRMQRLVFPPGDAAWKARWGATARHRIQETSIYKLTPVALLRGLARRLSGSSPGLREGWR